MFCFLVAINCLQLLSESFQLYSLSDVCIVSRVYKVLHFGYSVGEQYIVDHELLIKSVFYKGEKLIPIGGVFTVTFKDVPFIVIEYKVDTLDIPLKLEEQEEQCTIITEYLIEILSVKINKNLNTVDIYIYKNTKSTFNLEGFSGFYMEDVKVPVTITSYGNMEDEKTFHWCMYRINTTTSKYTRIYTFNGYPDLIVSRHFILIPHNNLQEENIQRLHHIFEKVEEVISWGGVRMILYFNSSALLWDNMEIEQRGDPYLTYRYYGKT